MCNYLCHISEEDSIFSGRHTFCIYTKQRQCDITLPNGTDRCVDVGCFDTCSTSLEALIQQDVATTEMNTNVILCRSHWRQSSLTPSQRGQRSAVELLEQVQDQYLAQRSFSRAELLHRLRFESSLPRQPAENQLKSPIMPL